MADSDPASAILAGGLRALLDAAGRVAAPPETQDSPTSDRVQAAIDQVQAAAAPVLDTLADALSGDPTRLERAKDQARKLGDLLAERGVAPDQLLRAVSDRAGAVAAHLQHTESGLAAAAAPLRAVLDELAAQASDARGGPDAQSGPDAADQGATS